MLKTDLANNIFKQKYALSPDQTWKDKARSIVDDVCGYGNEFCAKKPLLLNPEREYLASAISDCKFLPGGRYIYYAGRRAKFYNNCYLLRGEEDTREEWARLVHAAMSMLSCGGGIGVDYSVFRERGRLLSRTGGVASGPISLMNAINEIGRHVMQGGSRRSAIYASLNWQHPDVEEYLVTKNWNDLEVIDGYTAAEVKKHNFNFPAPLDMTNISLNYDDEFLNQVQGDNLPETFLKNVRQALSTGEPGFSFNFGDKQNETLRNACTEVTSEDDSDVCNLGSINLGNIETLEEFREIVRVAARFLVCGTLRAELPYERVYEVRKKNRRLGLGLMGIHEWLLKRGYRYEVNEELHLWLRVYKEESERAANQLCENLSISKPVAYRAIAPTGTIGILAGTTTGIEPLYSVAYKRRYLSGSSQWKYEYVVDHTAQLLIEQYGLNPDEIETANVLAKTPERRIKFQCDVQDYVDMAISSTINLPTWGTSYNNEDNVESFALLLAKYSPRLRGFTCYPDGSRGGQPITEVPYSEAINHKGVVYQENSEMACKTGVCGV